MRSIKFDWSLFSSVLKKKTLWLFVGLFPFYFLNWQALPGFEQSSIEIQVGFELLRVGFGLILFIIPGFMIFKNAFHNSRFGSALSVGFSLSYLVVGVLSTIARVVHLSFDFVQYGFIVMVGISGLIFFSFTRNNGIHDGETKKANEFAWSGFLLVPITCCALIALQPTFTFHNGDDLTYLAYLTRWQHSDGMSFQEILYGTQNQGPARFLFSLMPMGWAMVAKLSGVHGLLLLDGYLQFFLPIISIIGLYEVARSLRLSVGTSLISVLIQIICLMLLFDPNFQPGNLFFTRLDQDKVVAAFIMAPAFFLMTIKYLKRHSLTNLLSFFLVGLSLSLTHPIILVYSLIVIGLFCTLELYPRKKYKELTVLLCLAIILLSPGLYSRIVERRIGSVRTYKLDAAKTDQGFGEMTTIVEGTPFYGFNLNMFEIRKILDLGNYQLNFFLRWILLFFSIPMIVFGVIHFRESISARFILGSIFLIGLAGIPYTGWLLGLIVTPRQLWRVTWLYPFGIGIVFVFDQIFRRLAKIKGINDIVAYSWSDKYVLLLLCVLSLLTIILFIPGRLKAINSYRTELPEIKQLVRVGEILEQRIPKESIGVAPEPYNSTLPGLASRWNVMSFRGVTPGSVGYFLTLDEKQARKRAIANLFSIDVSPRQKFKLLGRYKIDYVFYPFENEEDFFLQLQYPQCFNLIAETSDFVVYQVFPDECSD